MEECSEWIQYPTYYFMVQTYYRFAYPLIETGNVGQHHLLSIIIKISQYLYSMIYYLMWENECKNKNKNIW